MRLWQARAGTHLRTLNGYTGVPSSVAFAPDGETLASVSENKTMVLWRVTNGSRLLTLEGHTSDITSVAFVPDGQAWPPVMG